VRYEVVQGNETFQVDVQEAGANLFDVAVDDGPSVRVDACRTTRTVYSVITESHQFEGSVDERDDGGIDVHVGTSTYDFHVIDARRRALLGATSEVATGKQELRAQMPGKIVKLLIRVGQTVEVDEGVAVIEAMKMENELRSPIRGSVTQIAVEEGMTVETGALLLVIEPPDEA